MKRFLLFLLCITYGMITSAQSLKKADVDKLVYQYVEKEKYDSASLMLVMFANQEHDKGNLETALEYQIKNCELIEQHINSFVTYGITLYDMYNNYGMVFVLQRDLNRTTDAIDTYIELARTIKRYTPNALPFYTNLIASTLGGCTIMPWADSVYCLQDALNVICQEPISKDNVKNYLWYCQCFNMNRTYNSFKEKIFVRNRIDEIENWYVQNRPYIHNLDTILYKREILEYDLGYADLLYLFAGAVSAQKQDFISAVELYSKEVAVLSSIGIADDLVDLKIASCYAKMANDYYQLGDLTLCKQYCDKAYPYIFNQREELEYCDILNALANSYYNINQANLAANLKLTEINIRERLEGSVSLTDWGMYFNYIVDVNPQEVISRNAKLTNVRRSEGGNAYYYMTLGRAYSMLMNGGNKYRDTAEMYFKTTEEVLLANNDYYGKYNIKNGVLSNLCEAWAKHYSRLEQREKSYEYSIKALQYTSDKYYNYYNVSLKSSLLHDIASIHNYLPRFYYGMKEDLYNILPILGSVESDIYLAQGNANLYHIPEWASWNPADSVSVSIAYDAALLMKGLTLRYNTISPYLESHPNLAGAKLELDRMRDSIYSITDENARLLALHRYELKEREILKDVNAELTNVHWKDIANELKNDEACIEFVKYTANAYSWCDSIHKPHYSAMVLLPNGKAPIFVDLFDEDELMDVYNLQPKSYDIEMGKILYTKIWDKLQPYIDGKRKVFFSPMGLLNLINTELLIDSTGQTAMDRFNLYRVSSTRNIQANDTGNVVVLSVASFGGVDYENADEYAEVIQNINTRGNWSYLQNSLSEVNQIESLLQQRNIDIATYRGVNATEDAFKHLDGAKSNVIHIASHGYYIPQSHRDSIPYFSNSVNTASIQDELFYSGLILSGGQKAWVDSTFKPDNNDGILTAYEISKLDLHNVDLVVLSACETGLGDNLFDGIFGLQRAFKKAGVKSILMSLWQIDDKATSEYMTYFYEKLVNGYSVHDAYSSTVLMMKEKYQDANYYASFVLLD